jgi:hypothetical protein
MGAIEKQYHFKIMRTYEFLRVILRTFRTIKRLTGCFAPSFVRFFYPFAVVNPHTCTQVAPVGGGGVDNQTDSCKAQVAARLAAVERAVNGISSFLLKPKELPGEDLFRHMVKKRLNDPRIKSHEPSVYLDLSCSKEQAQDFAPESSIMSFAHGNGAKMKLATRKLDNLGYIKSYGGVQIDPECLHRLTNKLELSQSLANIALLEKRDDQQAKDAIDTELRVLTPAAKDKLVVKGKDVSNITKKEICALLLSYFAVKEDINKKRNSDIVTTTSTTTSTTTTSTTSTTTISTSTATHTVE